MKKLYSLFTSVLCLLMCASVANAQTTTEDKTVTFCINVEDPSICYAMDGNYNYFDLQKGENVFSLVYHETTFTDGSSYGYSDILYLNIKDEYASEYNFSACNVLMAGSEQLVPYEGFWGASTSIAISVTPDMEGCVFYPETVNLDALRTATATVNVDDASNVMIRCGYAGYSPELVDGENIIKFNPETEAYWSIGTKEYNTYLGIVTLNGEEVADRYGVYEMYVTEGSVIDIVSQGSTEPVNVSFSFVNPGTEGAVTGVYEYINYEAVEIAHWQNGFSVNPHTEIIVSLDQNAYNINSLTVNGIAQGIYSNQLYITINQDSQIVIDAVKYDTFDITLTVTDPAHLNIGLADSMYSGTTPLVGLVPGTQVVSISSKITYMVVNPITGCKIERVAYVEKGSTEPVEVEAGYSGYYIPLTDTEEVIIESFALVRENTATLWVNDIAKCYMLSLAYADGSYCFYTYGDVPAGTGSQTFSFDATSDNPMSLFFSPVDYETPGYVLLNDELIEPEYAGSTYYEIEVNDGDVIKVYIGEQAPTTAISDITVSPAENSIYTITGVKVTNSTLVPGIYIINGKKVLVK